MARTLLLISLLLASGFSAQAQAEYPRVELFGGYSYANLDFGRFFFSSRQNTNGWGASINVNFNRHLGVTAEFAGQYGDIGIFNPPPGAGPADCPLFDTPSGCFDNVGLSSHQFLFGPRFSVRKGRYTAFGNVLVGVNRDRISSWVIDDTTLGPLTDTGLALGLGGGLDISLSRRISLRALKVDYLPTRSEKVSWASNLRLQTGLVVKLAHAEVMASTLAHTPASSLPADKQAYSRVEVFAGYSYVNIDSFRFSFDKREGASGWGTSVSFNLHKSFGLTADFAGQYGDVLRGITIEACLGIVPTPFFCAVDVSFSNYQFLFGPRLAGRWRLVTAFGHALLGASRRHVSGFTAGGVTFEPETHTDFALALGGGVDINLGRMVSIRALQLDYIPTRFQGSLWSDNVRLQAGVVFKLLHR